MDTPPSLGGAYVAQTLVSAFTVKKNPANARQVTRARKCVIEREGTARRDESRRCRHKCLRHVNQAKPSSNHRHGVPT